MAPKGKPLKNVRKTDPKLKLNQSNISTTQKATSSNRDNLEQNLRLPPKNELTYSAALRKNLIESLPVLPNSGFAEVSAVDEMTNPKGKMIPSIAGQPREYARIELDMSLFNIPHNNRTILPKPSSTLLTNDQLIPELNPDIKHCPMCDLLFPQDWSNQKINYHVFAHFDEDYKFATQNEWSEF